jgi:hypothetical protein
VNEMDSQLRGLLEAAVSDPPHRVTVGAVRRRVVRRRVIESVAGAAAVAVIAVAAGVGIGSFFRGPGPSAAGSASTVYVLSSQGVLTPISTTTDIPGKPIPVGREFDGPPMAMTPDGKTIYVPELNSVIPVSTVTNTAGKPIPLAEEGPGQILITPDGKTAYVLSFAGLTPIATETNTPGKPIDIGTPPQQFSMAITPDGRTLYVVVGTPDDSGAFLLPISTATNTPGKPIKIDMSIPFSVTTSPDGKTAFVVGMTIGSQGRSQTTVIPVATATNTPGEPFTTNRISGDTFGPYGKTLYFEDGNHVDGVIPFDLNTGTFGTLIRIPTGGFITATPDLSTIYVSTGLNYGQCPGTGQVMPISTATNVPERPIQIPCGGVIATISPDGKTLWVGAGDMLTPISTATNTPGNPIEVGGPLTTIRNRYGIRVSGQITAIAVTP